MQKYYTDKVKNSQTIVYVVIQLIIKMVKAQKIWNALLRAKKPKSGTFNLRDYCEQVKVPARKSWFTYLGKKLCITMYTHTHTHNWYYNVKIINFKKCLNAFIFILHFIILEVYLLFKSYSRVYSLLKYSITMYFLHFNAFYFLLNLDLIL